MTRRPFSSTSILSAARSAFVLALTLMASQLLRAQWTAPTEEELKMTSQPEVPGAPAVYLFKEETTEDNLHMWSVYVRLKVLTERGKENANVELHQYQDSEGGGYTVSEIAGRTIHSDGTILPFTGKPFEKLVEKGQNYKEMAKVFTLPDVQVGSIIEYRYKLRYDDQWYRAPNWFIQTDLYTRKAHYLWKPTDKELISKNERGESLTNTIAWTPILPAGTQIKQTRLPPTAAFQNGQVILDLNVHDIPPAPDEEHMPPLGSISYRVLFYYSPYRTPEEYWKNEGKGWAKNQEKFIGPGSKVNAAVKELVLPGDTQEQKLRKIYAAVMKLENSAYTRERSAAEEKSQGLKEAKTADDIWERKRGSDDELAELFVAMARAAGMKAYAMIVSDRDRTIFMQQYLSFAQLNDVVAIVNVDGKDQFFDPGQRECPYGQMAWKHTQVQGIRQVDGGAALSSTPADAYTVSNTKRAADLTLDEHGEATGTIKLTWAGNPALRWRQASLRGDHDSLERDLRTSVERMMPGGVDVKVDGIENLEEYEKPLIVSFKVKGQLASSTGKRLLVPGTLFEMNAKPAFPHEKRETPIYFEYPSIVADAVRITFPATLAVESIPEKKSIPFEKAAGYGFSTDSTPNSVTFRRTFIVGTVIYPATGYAGLRNFYGAFETKDQEPLVLKVVTAQGGN